MALPALRWEPPALRLRAQQRGRRASAHLEQRRARLLPQGARLSSPGVRPRRHRQSIRIVPSGISNPFRETASGMTRRGFTLLEIIVAVAITAMIGVTIAMAFTSGFKAKELVESEAEQYRGLRTTLDRMVREIGAAFVSDRYDQRRYRDQNDRPTNFIGTRDKLIFTSMAHQRLYADAKESDQMVVEYGVHASTQKGVRNQQDLMRRENPNVYGEDKMDHGGVEEVLLENVKRVEFSYWDSDQKDWVNDWDTRKLEKKSILPTRVRITLVRADENGHEQRYTTETRIMLNTVIPRF